MKRIWNTFLYEYKTSEYENTGSKLLGYEYKPIMNTGIHIMIRWWGDYSYLYCRTKKEISVEIIDISEYQWFENISEYQWFADTCTGI